MINAPARPASRTAILRGIYDPEDMVFGTIVGFNCTRERSSVLGATTNMKGCVVQLDDGREVAAILDLSPRGKSCFVFRFRLGSRVKVDLGTVRDPIRIVEILSTIP